jgi:bis(5'-nucleosyl)-tetraphosphatase (symmetrical)
VRQGDNLDAFFADGDADASLAWIASRPALVHIAAEPDVGAVWIVHAGLDPRWTGLDDVARRLVGPWSGERIDDPDLQFAVNVRCCTREGERSPYNGAAPGCPAPFAPWDAFYRGDTLVVHGHWAARGHYRGRRTLGLDSGCVHGGKLTAWCHEEDRIVQVPARS